MSYEYIYNIMNVNPLTMIVIISSILVTPFFILITYAFSGASLKKGTTIGFAIMILGGIISWICLAEIPKNLGNIGALIVPFCWLTPSIILLLNAKWFLDKTLSQHFLISLQLFRLIGGLFILEMTNNNIPGIFAYPAGIGDITVGLIAGVILLKYRRNQTIPNRAAMLVIISGVLDFAIAFFFGFTSSKGPQQIFFPEIINNTMQFPTGMIPLFLVPYAIFFHTLSWLQIRKNNKLK